MRAICLFLLIVLVSEATMLRAEEQLSYECNSEISYFWKKAAEEQAQEVKVKAIQAKDSSEERARSGLERAKITAAQEVMDFCRSRHESFSSCLASKLDSNAAVLQRLGFSSRAKLEEAIELDCKTSQGQCVSVKTSEAVCVAPPQPTASAEESKKEAKGGKK